jgi:hypothetical protein
MTVITPSVVWKYVRSFLKQEWSAGDYPIRIRHPDSSNADHPARWKPVRVNAAVINWWQMSGDGETEAEAVKDLATKLEARKARGERLPRPGTGLPIEFAASGRVEAHQRLAADFVKRVLGLDIGDCFISDESSLWDFHADEDNTLLYNKIMLIYGVDVSGIEHAKLADIFDRLAARGVSG